MIKPKTITGHGCPQQPPGRGPNGRRFCRWCHDEVGPRKQSWCDIECNKHGDFNLSKGYTRSRDRGVCVLCGFDSKKLERIMGHAFDWHKRRARWGRAGGRRQDLLRVLGWGGRTHGAMEEYDHIKSVKDGGSHHPDNLRTLCRPCHLDVTKAQRKKGS